MIFLSFSALSCREAMRSFPCDLHIHSCLSPCADDDMTPANICGMAALNGLAVVALTDHNTSKNCPAFFKEAKAQGLIPIGGMELTTAEEIHALCLFPTLGGAMDFDLFVEGHRMKIENQPEIFGNQLLIGENDEVTGTEKYLLFPATDLAIEEAAKEVFSRGGVLLPAHIDRPSGGILEVLGDFPDVGFSAFELRDEARLGELSARCPILSGLCHIVSSDAHHLWDISEGGFSIAVEDEPYSSALVRENILALLRGDAPGQNGL